MASVSVFDWSSNFRQRHWLRLLFADGTPVVYATITADKKIYNTDLEGNVLIDTDLPLGTSLMIRSEDSQRTCTLSLNKQEGQRCR